jgi:hypothetical protein
VYRYHQSSGILLHDGQSFAKGWAGQKAGENNPDMQDVHDIGPLPRGLYIIGLAHTHPHLGPVVMNLTPDGYNEMFGRADFRIHGSAAIHPELSSRGCIILRRPFREAIAAGTDKLLEVVQ